MSKIKNSELNKDFLRILPKVELHLHLDCSLSFEVVSKLDPNQTRQRYEEEFVAPPKCANLADLLTRAPRGFGLMQTESGLRAVTQDLFEQLQSDHVIYAEIRFAPLLHLEQGLTPEKVVEIVDDAVQERIEATGIQARIILCTLRHFSEEQSLRTIQLAERFRNRNVVAIDLAADEAGFPIRNHISSYQYAIQKGIFRTAHAGEARGPESIWETLRHFQPNRIGHGVRSIEDPRLIRYLRERQVHLEICPTSNDQINLCKEYADHPVDQLYLAGVPLSINTDGRTLCGISLTEEYVKLQRAFGWGVEEFLKCNLAAVEASFAPDGVKNNLLIQLNNAYQKETIS
jgi:adenosine deaminase